MRLRSAAATGLLAALAAGCTATSADPDLPEATVVVEDPEGDAQGGPGSQGDEGGQPPPGVDLTRVELAVAGERLAVTLESTEPIPAQASATGVHGELERGWWLVRFWDEAERETPDYLLWVVIDPMPGSDELRTLLCEVDEDRFGQIHCPPEENLLDEASASLRIDGRRLTVTVPADALAELRAPFQWSAAVTLNVTPAMANDWWDVVPDWPRGDHLQTAELSDDDEVLHLGEAAVAEHRERYGPPHPEASARAWFPQRP